jgi:hypothetical protein
MIPIFDSLAHPTLSGNWLDGGRDASFRALAASLDDAGYSGACAVGISRVGDYEDEAFIQECRRHQRLFPVAGFNPSHAGAISGEMQRLHALGYRAIKIHPRFTGLELTGPKLAGVRRGDRHSLLVSFVPISTASDRYPSETILFAGALKAAPRPAVWSTAAMCGSALRQLVRFNRTSSSISPR